MSEDPPIDGDAENPRGYGATAAPTKPECRLADLALRERWPIPDAAREAMIAQLAAVVSEPGIMKRKPRLFMACAKTLMGLSRVSLSAVDTTIRAKSADELAERVAMLELLAKAKGEGER